MTDDYSVDNTQMQSTTDPGEVGTESKPTTLAGELERLRFAVKELKQWCLGTIAQWYESPTAQAVVSEDARTNSVAVGLTVTRTTTAVPVAGIGVRLLLRAKSADEAPSDFAALDAVATDVTAGSEDTVLDVLLRVAGAALSAAFRFTTTTAFRAIFGHANTADRTYTLPDATTTLVGTDVTQTLSAKTLTTPTIGDFTNAQHAHTGAASGGAVAPARAAGGDQTGSYPNPTLAAAGPGATGPIGSASVIPVVTIDAKGRVTALGSATPVFSAAFESAEQTITADSVLNVAHGLGGMPKLVMVTVRNVSTEINYAVNDEVPLTGTMTEMGSTAGAHIAFDATNVTILTATLFQLRDKSTRASTAITASKWRYVVRAWR